MSSQRQFSAYAAAISTKWMLRLKQRKHQHVLIKTTIFFRFLRIRNFRACIIYNSKKKCTNFNEALRYAYCHWLYSRRLRGNGINRPDLQKKIAHQSNQKRKGFLLFKVTLSYSIFPNNSVLLDKHETPPPSFFTCPRGPTPLFTLWLQLNSVFLS